MRTIILLLAIFFYPFSGMCLDYYVNESTGTDSDTCGQLPTTPCKTIKKALDNIPDGQVTIKITRGTYVESELLVPVAAAGAEKNDITFEGGWNTSFTGSVCDPVNTVIVPGDRTAPPYIYLFHLSVFGGQRQGALTLRCLTLRKNLTGDIPRAIAATASKQGLVEINLEQIRLTGFAEQSTIFLGSHDNGTLEAKLDEVVIDKNMGYSVIYVDNHDGGSLDLTVKRSHLINNGSPGTSSLVVLYLSCTDHGDLAATVENTIFAHNYSSGDPPAIRSIVRNTNSTHSLDLLNTTITTNSNSSAGGGPGAVGIYAFDSAMAAVTLENSIIKINDSMQGPADFFLDQGTGAIMNISADYCILGEHETMGSVTFHSTNEVDADPGLNTSYHLTSGSPARDAGICGYLTGSGPYQYHRVAPYDDIDGDKRPGWGRLMGCDIGADEYRFPWILFNPAARGKRTP